MIWLFRGIWDYRHEILLAVQLIAKLRKSAAEFTREYIRRQVQTRLRRSLLIVAIEISLLGGALWLNTTFPSLAMRRLASLVLWGVTLYNLAELLLLTLPELKSLHRTLRGKVGYTLKYFLEVSLVTELLRLNVLFLFLCLAAGISTRTVIGTHFSYVKPWLDTESPRVRPPHRWRRHR